MTRNSTFLSLVAVLLWLTACAPTPTRIAFSEEGKSLILRCTLKNNQQRLSSSNYLGRTSAIRAGSSAKVTMYSQHRVDMTLNKIAYQMYPVSVPLSTDVNLFMEKYFVDSVDKLGLKGLEPAWRENIENGVYVVGMSKMEVYTALGPPNWINFGVDATNHSLELIMDTNRWEYRESDIMSAPWWPVKRILLFEEDALVRTEP